MHTLLLLRHAQAGPPTEADQLRALTGAGRDQAGRVAEHLRARVPDLVLCSAALRAEQTWQRLAHALADEGVDPSAVDVAVLDSLYGANPRVLLEEVRTRGGDAGTVLVVGHEPVVSMTAGTLAGPGSDDVSARVVAAGVPTATVCVLEAEAAWADLERSSTRLIAVLRTPVR